MERLLVPVPVRGDSESQFIDPSKIYKVSTHPKGHCFIYFDSAEKLELLITEKELADLIIEHSKKLAEEQRAMFDEPFQLEEDYN